MSRFNDTPFIGEIKEEIAIFDSINNAPFAESIADFIQTCETPMTIGLQGDWGTGKTSLMNMIKCSLKKGVHKIDLNTWHYSMFRQEDEFLGIVIIKSLVDELAKKFEIKGNAYAEKLKKVAGVLGNLTLKALSVSKSIEFGIPKIGGIVLDDALEAVTGKSKSVEIENLSSILLNFKQEFAKLITDFTISNPKERIFIFIDDLDRIRPVKAVEVLETLKNFMDVPGCVFVLAVDYEIVQLGIAEKFGKDIQRTSGKSFFDKIIQLPFSMPTSSYNIDSYITNLLKESAFITENYDKKETGNFFVDITEVTIGRNPRSIKRAVNYATLLEKIRRKNTTRETNKNKDTAKLLYAIVCMQIAWPELFEYFVLRPTADTVKKLEDWDFLEKLPQAKKLFARVNNIDDVKDNISAFFDTLYEVLDSGERDGVITDDELKPLIDILQLVRLTSEKNVCKNDNPIKTFRSILEPNATRDPESLKFFDEIYSKSSFFNNDNIEYKKAGVRYFTMIYNRRQIGSIVTLKTKPFILRLKESIEIILESLLNHPDYEIFSRIIKNLDVADSLTGIGDTEIDYKELVKLNDNKKAIKLLDTIFHAVVKTMKK